MDSQSIDTIQPTTVNLREVAAKAHDALLRALGPEGTRFFVDSFLKDPVAFRAMAQSRATTGSLASVAGLSGRTPVPASASVSENPPPLLQIAPTRVGPVRESKKWIRTGYELLVIPPNTSAWTIPLNFARVTVGCAGPRANDIELNFPGMSNQQAVLEFKDEQFTLTNENAWQQTSVNGEAVVSSRVLQDKDQLSIGPVSMQIFKLLDIWSEIQVVSGADVGKKWTLNRSKLYLGRRGQRYNDIELEDLTVSRSHARLDFSDGTYELVPESPHNPTRVNGEVVSAPRLLEDQDHVSLGDTTLVYRIDRKRGKRSLTQREVTILFSDLRGYSTIAENQPLKPLVDQLNEYLQAMGQVIHMHGGTLLSYQGDAVMAIFGAPRRHVDDPERAVQCALRLRQRLQELNEEWKVQGRPEFRAGIGINTGTVMVGDIGIAEHMEYAAMGDDTNVAARIEELTKDYHTDLIVSEKTWEKIQGAFVAECLGQVVIRGRAQPITIHKIVGPARPVAEERPRTCLTVHGYGDGEAPYKMFLSLEKTDPPLESAVGRWRGEVEAFAFIEGAPVVYRGSAEARVDAQQGLTVQCVGTAQEGNQDPITWTSIGHGKVVGDGAQSAAEICFDLDAACTLSFPLVAETRAV